MSPNDLQDNLTKLIVCSLLLLPILLPLVVAWGVWRWYEAKVNG